MTEQRPWPSEQSATGTLRPWHDTAVGYLAVLFEDPEEAQRARRSILAKAINEMVVDHRVERRWLAALVARQDEEVR